jgi:dipeptidyl aminopeptidase/acylaminoacyl peptidase
MALAASGGTARELLPGYEGNVAHIAWADSGRVMFIGDEGVRTILGDVAVDHPGRPNRREGGPVLTALDVARDGKSVALAAQTAAHPSEVFLWAPPERSPRRLTNSNPWLAGIRLAPQEVVRFKARDGLALEGLLIHPLDEKKGQRYPLILTVHGGPEAHYRDGWLTGYSDPGQLAAARGFAVFYPNYRGSTGRGVVFSKMGQGDPAGKEFDDLVDAVDHLVQTGLVDRARVGITGGSYGGYATAWCATRYSDRFAAGVMFVGISDLVSKAGTTDIPNEELLVHARRWPWEDWKLMMERSPISYLDKARTPLLILDGKDDPRVHPSQSLVFYRYLKARGQAPVRLVLYPGEGHGNRLAAHRLDYNIRMMQWMEHYLKGTGGAPPPYEIEYEEKTK